MVFFSGVCLRVVSQDNKPDCGKRAGMAGDAWD